MSYILSRVLLVAATCLMRGQCTIGPCTIPGTYVFSINSTIVARLRNDGVPEGVVLHGNDCIAVAGDSKDSCFWGPESCVNDITGSDASLPRNCPPPTDDPSQRYFIRVSPQPCGPAGRRPYQHAPRPHRAATDSLIAMLAALEHESIAAFTEMALYLSRHNAPRSLTDRLLTAARDESRHTVAMLHLANHLENTTPSLPEVSIAEPESLLAFAKHNAREGCVRETYGAVLAAYQSQRASDAVVRATFATIAPEEAQHAQLSWDVAAFVDTLLTEQERTEVAQTITEASAELADSLAIPPPYECRDALGLPAADVALSMYHQLRDALWSSDATVNAIAARPTHQRLHH